MSKKITNEEFIKKAIEKHGDKYNYDKVEYVNNATKVCILCKEHGKNEKKIIKRSKYYSRIMKVFWIQSPLLKTLFCPK